MMYQMIPSYHPEINSIQYHQCPSVLMPPNIQMSPYAQQITPQTSPLTYFSLDGNPFSTTNVSVSPAMSLYDNRSHSNTPLSHSPQIAAYNTGHQAVPALTLDNELVYNCNFLGQLQGSYEIETPAGLDQVSVIVPTLAEGDEPYAIVRRVCSDGEALPDQFIYQEPDRFILCSVNGNVEAEFRRGSNMKLIVTWDNLFNGRQTVWRRKGEVTFNLVSAESLTTSRRNSLSSLATASTTISSAGNSSFVGPNGMPMHIRPELLQHNSVPESRPYDRNGSSSSKYVSKQGFESNFECIEPNPTNLVSGQQEEAMFELIKAHCVGNSSLLKRMVHWAMKSIAMRRSPVDVSSVSEGRLWVTAHTVDYVEDVEIEECLQERLDDIKGAYREIRTGVYKQPEPQVDEPGLQHRLMKDSRGYWKIESHDVDCGKWIMCAQELPDGRWIDNKNDGQEIRVKLVPMSKILKKMVEEFPSEQQEVEKNMTFLFTNCNQKKLNSKLKGRNLNSNISNLKDKLEKQHLLRFAVQVATTADMIAQELDLLS